MKAQINFLKSMLYFVDMWTKKRKQLGLRAAFLASVYTFYVPTIIIHLEEVLQSLTSQYRSLIQGAAEEELDITYPF